MRPAHLHTALSHCSTVSSVAQLGADQQIIPYNNLNYLGNAGTEGPGTLFSHSKGSCGGVPVCTALQVCLLMSCTGGQPAAGRALLLLLAAGLLACVG